MGQKFLLILVILATLSLAGGVAARAELDLENDSRLKSRISPAYDPDRRVCALSLPQLENIPPLPPEARVNRIQPPCPEAWDCARRDMPYLINQLLDTIEPNLFEAVLKAPGVGFVVSYKEAGPAYIYYATDFTGQKVMVNKAKTIVLDKVVKPFMHLTPSLIIFRLDGDDRNQGAAFSIDIKTGAINIYDQAYVYYWPDAPVQSLAAMGGFGGLNEMLSPYNYRTHAQVLFTAAEGLPPTQKPGYFTEATQPDFPIKDPFVPTRPVPRLDYRKVHFSNQPCQ